MVKCNDLIPKDIVSCIVMMESRAQKGLYIRRRPGTKYRSGECRDGRQLIELAELLSRGLHIATVWATLGTGSPRTCWSQAASHPSLRILTNSHRS